MASEQTAKTQGPRKSIPLPVYGSDDCQLMTLQTAGTEFFVAPRITLQYIVYIPFRVVTNPVKFIRKVHHIITARRDSPGTDTDVARRPAKLEPLGLEPGELVRVKSQDEIRATLDSDGRYERLAYMDVVMDRYSGQTFRVRNRVDRFFDERNWRMLKLRNVVLLDGVHCQSLPDDAVEWAGCQRACFLFWKEAWLERVDGDREAFDKT